MNKLKIALILITIIFTPVTPIFAGGPTFDVPNTDASDDSLFGFFDLRDRETFIQVTNVDTTAPGNNVHIQIFDVSNNCNENDFFDFYTINDTHIYNLRDIVTNDGTPSGVVLPEGAYGVFIASSEGSNQDGDIDMELTANLRIIDNNGYEYRTNLQGEDDSSSNVNFLGDITTFNFNSENGVILSDIVGIPFDDDGPDPTEQLVDNILEIWDNFNVDIYDLNEVPFSCRNIVFACVDQEHPLLEELLEEVSDSGGSSSVASFEYGINEAIPHSKGGELLCPGNQITDGFVRLERLARGDDTDDEGIYFIGLNNGNGRGSIDAFWFQNVEIPVPDPT